MPAFIKDYTKMFSSEYEEVFKILSEFDYAFRADEKNRKRSYWNWRNYFAVDGTQWPDLTKMKLNDQNRHASQYNIIGPKVDALTGSLFQEKFDLDWLPMEGVRNTLTEAVQTSYYTDKEIESYEPNYEGVIRDAMIYLGVLKVQMSNRHNPLHNIAMRRVEPGYIVFDPYWISDDDYDCSKCWEIFHLSAEQIANKYNISNAMIDQEIKEDRSMGVQYEEFTRDPNELLLLGRKGHLHRVIEQHEMQEIETTRLIGQRMDSERWVPFPITNEKKKLEKYMLEYHIDPNTIRESPYTDRIHKIKTIAPEIVEEKMLEKGVSTVQIKRLPYIQLTANRAFGQNKGIVDDLIDIQQTINKRESKLTDLISTATGGGKLVNKALFDSPAKRQRFRERANDPSYIEFVEGDELTKERSVHYLNANQYPSQIINQLMRMWDIVDRVSKVPAALEAISENANESGVLFERKLQVARINTITLVNRVRDFRKKSAEAYYEQWQVAYNGPERTFITPDGKRKAHLNRRVYNEKDGKIYIQNRPDQIPRCHVIATESRSSPNRMVRDRAVYSELYNLASQTNPEYSSVFFELLLDTMDLAEEHKQRIREISALQQVRDRQRMTTEMANLSSQTKQAGFAGLQAEMGMQQIMAQMQPQQQQLPQQQIPEEEVEGASQEEPLTPESPEDEATPLAADQV
jgi:hypothetical protein